MRHQSAPTKLPAGVLSQHGYTHKWGFFDGICNGAGYKPFEVSFGRVQLAVDWAKGDVALPVLTDSEREKWNQRALKSL